MWKKIKELLIKLLGGYTESERTLTMNVIKSQFHVIPISVSKTIIKDKDDRSELYIKEQLVREIAGILFQYGLVKFEQEGSTSNDSYRLKATCNFVEGE